MYTGMIIVLVTRLPAAEAVRQQRRPQYLLSKIMPLESTSESIASYKLIYHEKRPPPSCLLSALSDCAANAGNAYDIYTGSTIRIRIRPVLHNTYLVYYHKVYIRIRII